MEMNTHLIPELVKSTQEISRHPGFQYNHERTSAYFPRENNGTRPKNNWKIVFICNNCRFIIFNFTISFFTAFNLIYNCAIEGSKNHFIIEKSNRVMKYFMNVEVVRSCVKHVTVIFFICFFNQCDIYVIDFVTYILYYYFIYYSFID